ncbi:MAG: hypothetical protein ACI4U4_01465 [Bacilli bacterium]
MKRKILYLVGIILFILILVFISIIYPVMRNEDYNKKLFDDVYSNSNIKNINYVNKSNNYYIVKNDKEIVVMDLNYDKINSVDVSDIYDSDLDIVYRRGNIYYEEKINDKDKLIYKYYNINNGKFVFDITVGGI